MQKLRIQNIYDKNTSQFDRTKFDVRETDGTISGKVSVSSKKEDKWISKAMPFTAFKSKIDANTKDILLHSQGELFEADFTLVVESFSDKQTGKEISFFKLIINSARGVEISKHSRDKGNGFAPQSNHIEEEQDSEIPF